MNDITSSILDALQKNSKKLIETGIDTEKTLNALIGTASFALEQNKKVVFTIGANTIRNPGFKENLLQLKRNFKKQKLKIAIIKGKNSYLSLKRFELFQRKKEYSDHEATFLIKIIVWLQKTESGDLDELNLYGKEFSLLDEVCCTDYACPHEEAEFKNGCYFAKSQEKAEKADIIIVSHALTIQHAIEKNSLLPDYSHLIIDEADNLEKAAIESLTSNLSLNSMQKPFERLKNFIADTGASEKIMLLLRKIEIFFGLVGILLEKEASGGYGFMQCSLLDCDTQSREWIQIKAAGELLIETATEILNILTLNKETRTLLKIKECHSTAQKQLAELKTILACAEKRNLNEIILILKNPEQNILIKRSPIHIEEVLNGFLFAKKASIILISDTLRTDHSFNYIRKELGLGPEFEEIALPAVFTNPEQVKVFIPKNLPEPMNEDYFITCSKLISNIIQKNQGRSIVLFTSKKALSATYHQIAPELKAAGFHLLAQGITGGKGKIIEHFKDEPEISAILATGSFWENAVFTENDLNCVMIHKLAFDFPNDPLVLARSKDYSDSFNEYYLPRAILRFKKIFNQFIAGAVRKKTAHDFAENKATLVILDDRIIQKNYGRQFLESLPEGIEIVYDDIVQGDKENLLDSIYKDPRHNFSAGPKA